MSKCVVSLSFTGAHSTTFIDNKIVTLEKAEQVRKYMEENVERIYPYYEGNSSEGIEYKNIHFAINTSEKAINGFDALNMSEFKLSSEPIFDTIYEEMD